MEQVKVLLVEDDQRFGELQRDFLEHNSFDVTWLTHGRNVAEEVSRLSPHVVILDLMLPGGNGLDICREIRGQFTGKIAILTSSDDDIDHVACLEVGADDFMIKPIRPRVLLARIRMLLRREEDSSRSGSITCDELEQLECGPLILKRKTGEAIFTSRSLKLTASEFKLLWILTCNADEIMSREVLFKELRGIEFDGIDRTVDTKVVSLRKKLLDVEGSGQLIITVRNKGYMFCSDGFK